MPFLHSNQLALPFRRATQLSLATALCRYVTDKYSQHPDEFRDDLAAVDALRRDAVNVHEAHVSGVSKLQAYAAQLAWMTGKFPEAVGAAFSWYPALGYHTERPVVQDSLRFERLNVLWNLAALYGQLAAGTTHGDAAGLKTAASYYAQAAGVLEVLQDLVAEMADPNPDAPSATASASARLPDDLDLPTLESLEQLMLAQAQECFWMRAVGERYKDATIAKLAARLSDLYGAAGDAAVRSDAVSHAWIHHMSAKQRHFAAAAQYRAALDCLEKGRYGEEVARLQDALQCANDGLYEGRGGLLSKPVLEDLQSLKRRVEEDLKRAEKDNDIIYLNIVPPKSELKLLDRANMAVAKAPPQVVQPFDYLGADAEFGAPLFDKLVPFAVHLAVSIYEERRDRLVQQGIVQDLEALTEQLHAALLALHLPGALQALERPLGLPGTLTQHAEELRHADVLHRIPRSFADMETLRAADRATLDEGRGLLAAEQDEDTQRRQRYGADRWTRPPGPADEKSSPSSTGGSGSNNNTNNSPTGAQLWRHVAEIEGYLASSAASDGLVRNMFAGVRDQLALLAGPERALLDAVPQSRRVTVPAAVQTALGRVRSAYNDVLRQESRRRKRVDALHDQARADDVRPDMLRETARLERAGQTQIVAAHFDNFFTNRLRDRYGEAQAQVERERAEQERLLDVATRATRALESQRASARGSGSGSGSGGGGSDPESREREAVLQRLDAAYNTYREIVKNVEVGRTFYNDLGRITGAFRDQCRSWVAQRRAEAQNLEEELNMPILSSLSLGTQVRPQQSLPQPAAPVQPWNQPQPLSVQPATQQTWSPAVGIQFGAPSISPTNVAPGNRPPGTWDPSSGIRFG